MEFLKDVLGEELYKQVEAKLSGNDKIKLANLADGRYVGKDKFEAETGKVKSLQKQLDERDTQLNDLQEKAKGNEALESTIERLKGENEAQKNQYEADIAQRDRDAAIADAVRTYGPKNEKAVLANLDQDKIEFDGKTLKGVTEQMDALKKSDGYLFNETQVKFNGVKPGEAGDRVSETPSPGTLSEAIKQHYAKGESE